MSLPSRRNGSPGNAPSPCSGQTHPLPLTPSLAMQSFPIAVVDTANNSPLISFGHMSNNSSAYRVNRHLVGWGTCVRYQASRLARGHSFRFGTQDENIALGQRRVQNVALCRAQGNGDVQDKAREQLRLGDPAGPSAMRSCCGHVVVGRTRGMGAAPAEPVGAGNTGGVNVFLLVPSILAPAAWTQATTPTPERAGTAQWVATVFADILYVRIESVVPVSGGLRGERHPGTWSAKSA